MKNLSISAGQPGRLVFNLSEGVNGMKPVGYVAVTEYPGARPVATAMRWVAADHALYFPPMPFGCFFYEVRLGALEVAKGHIDVAPTPFPYDEQEFKTWVVSDGDIVNDVATFNIDAAPGLQGPQGEKGETGEKGDTGASAYQLAAQYGYAGTEAEWIAELQGAQAAADSAKASAATATTAAATATEAKSTATAASTAAQEAQQIAKTSAEQADATLNAAAKKTENNTFTGTNTFNGTLVANGGINGLTAPAGWNSAVSLLGSRFGSFVSECMRRKITTSFAVQAGAGTIANSVLTAAAGADCIARNSLGWKRRAGSYSTVGALWLPLSRHGTGRSGSCRVCVELCCSLKNYTKQEQTMMRPIYAYSAAAVYRYAHFNVIEFTVEYAGEQQKVTLLSPIVTNGEMVGMREQVTVLNTSNLVTNHIGITGFLIVRTAENAYEVFAVTEDSSCKFHNCGGVWAKSELYSGEGQNQKLYICATGSSWVLPTELIMEAMHQGTYTTMAAQVAQATGTPTVTDYTFEEFNAKYGIE